jgi:hypothetical protein
MMGEEQDAVPRVQRQQDRRPLDDLHRAERPDHGEPAKHDRSEHAAHPPRAVTLAEEQEEEDQQRERQHVVLERGCGDLDPLGRAQHRDRGRDDAVAIEEGGAEQPEHDQRAVVPLLPHERE